MYIMDLINSIQKRPLMYVQEEKIDYIAHLLMGYCIAASHNNAPSEMDKNFWAWFGYWLDDWMKVNYSNSYEVKTLYWHEILKDITDDEREAVELFYRLCKQFFKDFKQKNGYFNW